MSNQLIRIIYCQLASIWKSSFKINKKGKQIIIKQTLNLFKQTFITQQKLMFHNNEQQNLIENHFIHIPGQIQYVTNSTRSGKTTSQSNQIIYKPYYPEQIYKLINLQSYKQPLKRSYSVKSCPVVHSDEVQTFIYLNHKIPFCTCGNSALYLMKELKLKHKNLNMIQKDFNDLCSDEQYAFKTINQIQKLIKSQIQKTKQQVRLKEKQIKQKKKRKINKKCQQIKSNQNKNQQKNKKIKDKVTSNKILLQKCLSSVAVFKSNKMTNINLISINKNQVKKKQKSKQSTKKNLNSKNYKRIIQKSKNKNKIFKVQILKIDKKGSINFSKGIKQQINQKRTQKHAKKILKSI